MLFTPRRRATTPATTDEEAPAEPRRRRSLEDLYRLIDDNLAILD